MISATSELNDSGAFCKLVRGDVFGVIIGAVFATKVSGVRPEVVNGRLTIVAEELAESRELAGLATEVVAEGEDAAVATEGVVASFVVDALVNKLAGLPVVFLVGASACEADVLATRGVFAGEAAIFGFNSSTGAVFNGGASRCCAKISSPRGMACTATIAACCTSASGSFCSVARASIAD